MKSPLALALLTVFLVGCGPNSKPVASETKSVSETSEKNRIVEKGFSWVPPEGWTVKENPMATSMAMANYKIAVGEFKDGFGENINVVNEPASGSLQQYLEAATKALKGAAKDFKLGEGLTTESGLQVVSCEFVLGTIRERQFYVDLGDSKLVFTYAQLKDAPVGDARILPSIKSIRKEAR